MKRRLSVGVALLHSPSLLILDEPTNGLDPNGIIEMRDLLVKLYREFNITVLVSSHLLSEIEKVINHLIILNDGTVAFQGSFDELKSLQSSSRCILIETNDIPKTIDLIKQQGIKVLDSNEDQITFQFLEKDELAAMNSALFNAGILINQVSVKKDDLESIFIELTKQ